MMIPVASSNWKEPLALVMVDNLRATQVHHRYVIEAEVNGRHSRLICDISAAVSYPVSCFPL